LDTLPQISRISFFWDVCPRHCIQTGCGANPASSPRGTAGFLHVGVKRPGRETDHSPPSSAEVKNEWSYTFTLPYVFMAWCLIEEWILLRGVVFSKAQRQILPSHI
jgi:hypothetical protein